MGMLRLVRNAIDRERPSRVVACGAALVALGLLLVPVIWWLAHGVVAARVTESELHRIRSQMTMHVSGDVLLALALAGGVVSFALLALGAWIGALGIRRSRSA